MPGFSYCSRLIPSSILSSTPARCLSENWHSASSGNDNDYFLYSYAPRAIQFNAMKKCQ